MDRRQKFDQRKAPKLVSERQSGVSPGRDFAAIQTEDNRRKRGVAATPAVEEPAAGRSRQQPNPPDNPPKPDAAYDRFHKWSRQYVTVSKDHNAGEDPILNPGYKSAAASFSSIQDAVNFAANTLVPKLANKWERVVVEVHGGYYEEDVTITGTWTAGGAQNRVDLYGIGKPMIYGKLLLTPSADQMDIIGFEILKRQIPDARALTFDEFTSVTVQDGPPPLDTTDRLWGYEMAPVRFIDCDIWGDFYYGVDFQRPVFCHNTYFRSTIDYPNFFPLVRCRISQFAESAQVRQTEFNDCRIVTGQKDVLPDMVWLRGHALLVEGTDALGVIHSPTLSPEYLGLNRTGVILRNSTIVGYETCHWWNLAHIDCDCIGGYPLVEGANGNVFCLAVSNATLPGLEVDAKVYFEDCEINSRYIIELTRNPVAAPPGTPGVPRVWIRNIAHYLPPLAMAAGDAIVDNNLLGQSHVVDSFTPRGQWLTAGAITVTNSPVAVPPQACEPPFMML